MDFELSEDQVLLQESVTRFVADKYSFEQRRKLVDTDQGFSDKQWSQFAELGWLGMPFAEDVGGYGGTPVETMVVLEEFEPPDRSGGGSGIAATSSSICNETRLWWHELLGPRS